MKHLTKQHSHLTHPKFLTTTWLLSTLTLYMWATLAWAIDIPPAWRDALQDTGTARVIVVLNVPVQPEGMLNEADAIVAQRANIAQAQQLLLDSLQPQGSADMRFETIPALVMVVNSQTLTQLQDNPLVASLQLDAADEAMAGQTIANQVKELERVYKSSHSYAEVATVRVSPASAREGDVRELMVANLQSVGITVARGEESASGRQVRAAIGSLAVCGKGALGGTLGGAVLAKVASCGGTTAGSVATPETPVVPCTGITTGLVACYPFDGNALDGSGNGNHGTATWNTSYKDGKVGKAIDLNLAVSSYVYIPNPAQKFTTQYTVSGFFLIKSETGGIPFSKYSYNAGNGYPPSGFILGFSNVDWSDVTLKSGRTIRSLTHAITASPSYTLPLNQFKYVTAVYDNGNSKLYIDGKLIGETTGKPLATLDNPYPMLIGISLVNGQIVSYSQGFNGMVDELRIYNRALSDTEVKQLAVLSGVKMVTLTVTKTGTGQGQVTSSDATLNCGTTCKADYAQNSTVTLTATPTTGATFTQWSGACSGTTATTTVTLDQAKTCTATFQVIPKYTLTVSKTGTGAGGITGTGISCGSDCTENVVANTPVTLTATATTGSSFTGWSGACTGTNAAVTVTLDQAKSCTATFDKVIPKYTLTVSKTGTGTGSITGTGITCGTDCTEDYNAKTLVTLTATPDTGSQLVSWGGACSGTATTATVTMTAAKTCTANFAPANATTFTLTVAKAGAGQGTIRAQESGQPVSITCKATCATGSYDYPLNKAVTLTATAATNFTFKGWSCNGSYQPATNNIALIHVPIDAAKTCTATFE